MLVPWLAVGKTKELSQNISQVLSLSRTWPVGSACLVGVIVPASGLFGWAYNHSTLQLPRLEARGPVRHI